MAPPFGKGSPSRRESQGRCEYNCGVRWAAYFVAFWAFVAFGSSPSQADEALWTGSRAAGSGSRVLIYADGYWRNGKWVDHKGNADIAIETAKKEGQEIDKVLVWRRHPGRTSSWKQTKKPFPVDPQMAAIGRVCGAFDCSFCAAQEKIATSKSNLP